MKNTKKLLSILLVLFMLLQYLPGGIVVFAAETKQYEYSSQYNSGKRGQIATTLNGTNAVNYYTGNNQYDILSKESAAEIKASLNKLMTSTHSYISSYDDCHDMANRTDCEQGTGEGNSTKTQYLSLIYTSYTATQSQWNGWNREHVWPKSLGGDSTKGGGADLHHIRPSDATVNNTRNNNKYGNSNGGTAKYGSNPASGYLGGYLGSGYFEPLDNVKGDVARICLYVYVRWGSAWGASNITSVFESIDV